MKYEVIEQKIQEEYEKHEYSVDKNTQWKTFEIIIEINNIYYNKEKKDK